MAVTIRRRVGMSLVVDGVVIHCIDHQHREITEKAILEILKPYKTGMISILNESGVLVRRIQSE